MRKSNSVPILCNKELNTSDINRLSATLTNTNNCKHNSLKRNDNSLRINTKLLVQNNKSNSKSSVRKIISDNHIESILSPRINSRKSKYNLDNLSSISDKEPLRRVIKITEIIEINNKNSNKLTKHELLNKYCFNNNDSVSFIEMTPQSFDTNDSDSSNNVESDAFRQNNQTFVKTTPVSRNIEINSTRKPHQIRSTTHVKSNDEKKNQIKIETEKKYDKLDGGIMMEIMKLTNESLNNIDSKNAQLTRTNTLNNLKRQPKVVEEEEDNSTSIPVVHNLSFYQNDANNKPKRITIKITGRTRSASTDKKTNLVKSKANFNNLGNYRLDEICSQQNEPIELKVNNRLFETIKTNDTNARNQPTTSSKSSIHFENNIPNESKFNLIKFKSYLNNLKDSTNLDNRSSSLPPNERDSIYGFRTKVQRPLLARKEEDEDSWMNIFNSNSEFTNQQMFDYLNSTTKPFQSNQHMSLIKNAGDIISNGSAFSSINKLDNCSLYETTQPIWSFREDENTKKTSKKPANISSFSCGLLNAKQKNISDHCEEQFSINELDYSPSFYSNGNQSVNEIFQLNDKITNGSYETDSYKGNNNFASSLIDKMKYDEKTSSLPIRNNKSLKKASSYYNDYYRDKELFINGNKNCLTNNQKNTVFERFNAKYIDDETDDTTTTSDERNYGEISPVYQRKPNIPLDESIRSGMPKIYQHNNILTKRSNLTNNDSILSSEATLRTPKLSRRVIFADEC